MDNLFAAHAATSIQQLYGGALKPPRKRTKTTTIPMKADIDTSRPRHLPTLRAGYRYTQRIEERKDEIQRFLQKKEMLEGQIQEPTVPYVTPAKAWFKHVRNGDQELVALAQHIQQNYPQFQERFNMGSQLDNSNGITYNQEWSALASNVPRVSDQAVRAANAAQTVRDQAKDARNRQPKSVDKTSAAYFQKLAQEEAAKKKAAEREQAKKEAAMRRELKEKGEATKAAKEAAKAQTAKRPSLSVRLDRRKLRRKKVTKRRQPGLVARAKTRGLAQIEKRTEQVEKKRKKKENAKRQAAVESYEADERATLAVQRRVRGNQGRKEANRLRAAIVSVQAAQRGRSVREQQAKLREAITELQAALRGADSRAEFESLKQQIAELESMRQAAATTVQSVVRGQQARRQQQALEGVVTKLQAMVRGRQGRAASDIPQTFSGDQQMADSGADTDIDDEEFDTGSEEEFAQQLASVEPEGFSNGTQANGPGTATNAQQPEPPLPDVTPEEADDMYPPNAAAIQEAEDMAAMFDAFREGEAAADSVQQAGTQGPAGVAGGATRADDRTSEGDAINTFIMRPIPKSLYRGGAITASGDIAAYATLAAPLNMDELQTTMFKRALRTSQRQAMQRYVDYGAAPVEDYDPAFQVPIPGYTPQFYVAS